MDYVRKCIYGRPFDVFCNFGYLEAISDFNATNPGTLDHVTRVMSLVALADLLHTIDHSIQ